MRNKFFFTAGIAGMLSGVASGATDGAGVDYDYGKDRSPYVTLRGGWLFGNFEFKEYFENSDVKQSVKNAWSGSAEFGVSRDDDIFVGLELGYFAEKMKPFGKTYNPPIPDPYRAGDRINHQSIKLKTENFFGTCNVTLRRDLGERSFFYGGVGAGVARRILEGSAREAGDAYGVPFDRPEVRGSIRKWRFLGQAFAGIGVYLNVDWQLTVGYRLRWMPKFAEDWEHDLRHAAEIGLTYQF